MSSNGAKATPRRTPSYLELTARIRELEAERARVRDQEVSHVIARLRETIDLYGITAEELGFQVAGTLSGGRQGPRPPKYADGQGHSWSGLGPKPRWLREALAAGRSEEEFRVR